MKYYFKKTLFGQVLMVQDRNPGNSPGEWEYYYRRATEKESQDFKSRIDKNYQEAELLEKIRNERPDLLL